MTNVFIGELKNDQCAPLKGTSGRLSDIGTFLPMIPFFGPFSDIRQTARLKGIHWGLKHFLFPHEYIRHSFLLFVDISIHLDFTAKVRILQNLSAKFWP